MSVRFIEAQDKLAIIDLARVMHSESPAYREFPYQSAKVGQLFDLCLKHEDWCCLIAEKNGGAIGFMAFGLVEMLFCDLKTVDDLALYILPEHRGGVDGARMVRMAVQWAIACQASEVRLGVTTEIDNSRVAQFLGRLGFSHTGELMTLKI